jgi:hypothetical protein
MRINEFQLSRSPSRRACGLVAGKHQSYQVTVMRFLYPQVTRNSTQNSGLPNTSFEARSSCKELYMDTSSGRSYFDLAKNDWLYRGRYLVRHCLSCALDAIAPQVQYGSGVFVNEHFHKYVRGLCAQDVRRDWS